MKNGLCALDIALYEQTGSCLPSALTADRVQTPSRWELLLKETTEISSHSLGSHTVGRNHSVLQVVHPQRRGMVAVNTIPAVIWGSLSLCRAFPFSLHFANFSCRMALKCNLSCPYTEVKFTSCSHSSSAVLFCVPAVSFWVCLCFEKLGRKVISLCYVYIEPSLHPFLMAK